MLEILLLFFIGKNIASIAKRKNRSPTGYVLLLVFGWFGGEIIGGITGAVIAEGAQADEGLALLFMIGGALVGIVLAVVLAFAVVNAATPLERRPDAYDDYDADPRPRRRRRYEDDEDDRPRSRRQEYDDEDEDDRPRYRRGRDDEDDDRSRRRRDDD